MSHCFELMISNLGVIGLIQTQFRLYSNLQTGIATLLLVSKSVKTSAGCSEDQSKNLFLRQNEYKKYPIFHCTFVILWISCFEYFDAVIIYRSVNYFLYTCPILMKHTPVMILLKFDNSEKFKVNLIDTSCFADQNQKYRCTL